MIYPYKKEYDYFISFSAGKDSTIMLVDLLKQGIKPENIFLFVYQLGTPEFTIDSRVLDFYKQRFNLFIIRDLETEKEFHEFVKYRKNTSSKPSVFLRGDADYTFRYTCLNRVGLDIGCDYSIAPFMFVPYDRIWSEAANDNTEFLISSILFPADSTPDEIKEKTDMYVGNIMTAKEYFDLLIKPEQFNVLKFQTILVRNKVLGGYLFDENTLTDMQAKIKERKNVTKWTIL